MKKESENTFKNEKLNELENEPIKCHVRYFGSFNESYSKKIFVRDMFVTSFVTCFRAVFNINKPAKHSIGERVFAAVFLLAFVLGLVGLAVGIIKSLLILSIIGIGLLLFGLFQAVVCAKVSKDRNAYYVRQEKIGEQTYDYAIGKLAYDNQKKFVVVPNSEECIDVIDPNKNQ